MDRRFCPSHKKGDCWYANVLQARSDDGGATFTLPPVPERVAFVTPYRYVPDGGRQGFSDALALLRSPQADGFWYTLVTTGYAAGQPGQKGMCLWRTDDVSNPGAWRGWDGRSFALTMRDPYRAAPQLSPPLCAPVLGPHMRMGWTYNTVAGAYVATGIGSAVPPNGTQRVDAVVYATSTDMVHWGEETFLMPLHASPYGTRGYEGQVNYPVLLDAGSPGRNFEFTGESPYLFGVIDSPDYSQRNVYRWEVSIERAS